VNGKIISINFIILRRRRIGSISCPLLERVYDTLGGEGKGGKKEE
jgi:hypothetical protein